MECQKQMLSQLSKTYANGHSDWKDKNVIYLHVEYIFMQVLIVLPVCKF